MFSSSNRILPIIVAGLAFVPAVAQAYLGHFSRMTYDDYCVIRAGQELGAWEAMIYWFHHWTPSFFGFWLASAFSFLDAGLPALWPVATMALWVAAVFWIAWQALTIVGIEERRRLMALSIAGLAVAVCVNAFPSGQVFYWHIPSMEYFLPLVMLSFTAGLAIWTWRRKDSRLLWAGLFGVAVGSFLSAGFNEVFLVSQIFLSMLGLLAIPWMGRSLRMIIMSAWAGTCLSLIIQLQSPGVLARMSHDAGKFGAAALHPSLSVGEKLASAWHLLPEALRLTFVYAGSEEAFAGFALLMCLGLVIALGRPGSIASGHRSQKPIRLTIPLWLFTVSQLLFTPVLWSHTSDAAIVFGRFSLAFAVVIALNMALIIGAVIALWFVIVGGKAHYGRVESVVGALFGLCLLMFALTQLRSIHSIAASYLFMSAIATLAMMTWMLAAGIALPTKIALAGPLVYGLALALLFVNAGTGLLGRGIAAPRIMTFSATMLVMSGLVWGVALGELLRRWTWNGNWPRRVRTSCFVMIIVIAAGIALGKLSHVPAYARFAGEWDARHEKILAMRDAGERNIVVAPLASASEWAAAEDSPGDAEHHCVKRYYGVESIRETGS